jgi:hypothetical protein
MNKFTIAVFQDLLQRCLNNETVTVRFNTAIGETELDISPFQKADLMRCVPDDGDSWSFVFNLAPYDGYNDRFAERTYYDDAQQPVLTAKEAKMYQHEQQWCFAIGETIPFDIL